MRNYLTDSFIPDHLARYASSLALISSYVTLLYSLYVIQSGRSDGWNSELNTSSLRNVPQI